MAAEKAAKRCWGGRWDFGDAHASLKKAVWVGCEEVSKSYCQHKDDVHLAVFHLCSC